MGRDLGYYNEGKKGEGLNEFTWKGKGSNGQYLPNGIYFYEIRAYNLSFKGKIYSILVAINID